MSGKSGKGVARAVPRAYGRPTRHERDTVQRMPGRGASCREIARGAGQVALDGERRGVVAQVRHGAQVQARRARRRRHRPVGGLPAPGGVAALPRRLRPVSGSVKLNTSA